VLAGDERPEGCHGHPQSAFPYRAICVCIMRYFESSSGKAEASMGGDCHRSIAATSFGVAGRMEGHAIAFSKQTNSIFSPSARGTESFLERRKPPRKCRLNEWSPGETWYTLICRGEMEPTFEPSRKTLTTPPSPIAGLRRWPRPSRERARTTTRLGNAGQIRFGARHNRMVAPTWASMPCEVSPALVAVTTSDPSPSWFIVLFYTDRHKRNTTRVARARSRGDHGPSDHTDRQPWQSMRQMMTRKVQLEDVEIAIAEGGMGGQPLLLLHGFTGAKEDFTDWVDALAALGWHAVAPDHRGHGDSSKPASVEAYSMSILAKDSAALVDALGWEGFVLLGHSMGGFVAQRMAIADPTRTLALILMDTGHGPVEAVDPDLVTLAATIAVESGIDTLADLMAEIDSPLDTAAHRRLLEDRPEYAQFEDRKFRSTSPYLYASIAQELTSCPDSLAGLGAMDPQPPTLVLVGEQDVPFLGSAQRMAGVLPKSTLAVIPDAGHSPQFENPDAWWQTVSSFLESIRDG